MPVEGKFLTPIIQKIYSEVLESIFKDEYLRELPVSEIVLSVLVIHFEIMKAIFETMKKVDKNITGEIDNLIKFLDDTLGELFEVKTADE